MWTTEALPELGAPPPLLVRAGGGTPRPAELFERAAADRSWIRERLAEHGALLFRGFLAGEPAELEAFCTAAGLHRMIYTRGNTRRHAIGERIYTSTEVPGALPIPVHGEMSYRERHPTEIAFLCCLPAQQGGETPVADLARAYDAIPEDVRLRFEERGLIYVQWVPGRRLLPWRSTWQEMFDTDDRAEVERTCRRQGMEACWLRGGLLELRDAQPAVRVHASSGRKVWFNHAHIFHPSFAWELRRVGLRFRALGVRLAEALLAGPLRRLAYRRWVLYGDGSPIARADIEVVRGVLWSQARGFGWKQGDLMLLDNLRIGHARMPFRGPRRLVTALIDVNPTAS